MHALAFIWKGTRISKNGKNYIQLFNKDRIQMNWMHYYWKHDNLLYPFHINVRCALCILLNICKCIHWHLFWREHASVEITTTVCNCYTKIKFGWIRCIIIENMNIIRRNDNNCMQLLHKNRIWMNWTHYYRKPEQLNLPYPNQC